MLKILLICLVIWSTSSCHNYVASYVSGNYRYINFSAATNLDSLIVPCDRKYQVESYKINFFVNGEEHYYESCRDSGYINFLKLFATGAQINVYDIQLSNNAFTNSHIFSYSRDSCEKGTDFRCEDLVFNNELCKGIISTKEFSNWDVFPFPRISGYSPHYIAQYRKKGIAMEKYQTNDSIAKVGHAWADSISPTSISITRLKFINEDNNDTINLPNVWLHIK